MLFMSVNAYAVTLTNDQFKNLGLINKELIDNFPAYKYLNGSKDDMTFVGIDDSTAQTFIDGLNIDNLKKKDPKRKAVKKLRNKFKSMGLDDEDLLLLGLKNDIPDTGV